MKQINLFMNSRNALAILRSTNDTNSTFCNLKIKLNRNIKFFGTYILKLPTSKRINASSLYFAISTAWK